ncbi:MAG: glycosyltransferase family 2 protein, partial [Solirubrobacteraceae bacterium]
MARSRSYLAVVPAYNESSTVARVVESVREGAPEFDLLIIDDVSTDATADLGEQCGAYVLRLPFNLGIGGAVQAGFIYAREHGYDYVAQVDADGQHDPRELGKLVEAMHGP